MVRNGVIATPIQSLEASYSARQITIPIGGAYDGASAYPILEAPPNAHIKMQSISAFGTTASSGTYFRFVLIPPGAAISGNGTYGVGANEVGSYVCIEGMGFGGVAVPPTNPIMMFPQRNAMNMIVPAGWTLAVQGNDAWDATAICGFSAVGIFEYTPQSLSFVAG